MATFSGGETIVNYAEVEETQSGGSGTVAIFTAAANRYARAFINVEVGTTALDIQVNTGSVVVDYNIPANTDEIITVPFPGGSSIEYTYGGGDIRIVGFILEYSQP